MEGEGGMPLVVCFLETAGLGGSRHTACVCHFELVHADGHAHANSAGCCTA